MDYYKFKELHLEYIREQQYSDKQLYWHASEYKFDKFKEGITFIARNVNFFLSESHYFNILKNKKYEYLYAVRPTRQLRIFNPRNPNDINFVTPKINVLLANDPNQQHFLLLWQEYLKNGYWRWIEQDAAIEMSFNSKILNDVIELYYDGFIIASNSGSIGLGVFNSSDLRLVGTSLSRETFIRIFNTNTVREVNMTPDKILAIVQKAEALRNPDEVELLNAMGFVLGKEFLGLPMKPGQYGS